MKVKVICDYNDTELKRLVKTNEEFEVTEARGKTLIAAKVAEKVDTPAADAGNTAPSSSSSTAKKRGKKKEE